MSTIYEQSTSNPSTQLTTFVEFEFNKTSLVYSGLILVSFRSAWACIRSVHSTYIDVYCFRMVKMEDHNHKILYDPAQPTNSEQGWMYLDAISGGWTSSITDGVVKFQRERVIIGT